eukprot:Skav209813  [mRNA]  locus=scaffold5597:74634:89594:- [translate_table: standard]
MTRVRDGFSIGSNDLTQLTLGLDRDSGLVAQYFDERNPAVMKGLETLIKAAKAKGKYVGICGQGPSDHPDLAKWLMEQGIDSVSSRHGDATPTIQERARLAASVAVGSQLLWLQVLNLESLNPGSMEQDGEGGVPLDPLTVNDPWGVDDTPFDTSVFDTEEKAYGRNWLLQVRETLLPIEKPFDLRNLKAVAKNPVVAKSSPSAPPPDEEGDRDRIRGRDRKGQGKGNQKGQGPSNNGRFIPEMGRTEIVPRSQRGTWWRNCCRDRGEVIVREQFLLTSEEICRVPWHVGVLRGRWPLRVETFIGGQDIQAGGILEVKTSVPHTKNN